MNKPFALCRPLHLKSSMNKSIVSGFWYTLSSFLLRGLSFITAPIFTRLMTTAEIGEFSNYASWLSIIMIVATLGLDATMISAKFDYKDKLDSYCFSTLTMSSGIVLLWAVVFNCFPGAAETFFSLPVSQLNIMLLYLAFLTVLNMYLSRQRLSGCYKSTIAVSLSVTVASTLLALSFVMFGSNKTLGRILGNALPTIAVGAFLFTRFAVRGRKLDLSCWKYAIVICLPYIPHLLSLTMLNSVDVIMIRRICGSHMAALYSIAYTCGTIVTLLITSMNNAYSPWLADKLAENDLPAIRKASYGYIGAFAYLALGIMLLAPEVLLIVGGRPYMEAKYVMPPVAMGCFCQFLYTTFVNVEQFKKKTVGMAFASASAALLNYVLNAIFIPKYGYIAAAYTTLIGFLWLLLVHMFLIYRLGYSTAYDYRFIFGMIGLMLALTGGISLLYGNTIVRYCVILLFGAVSLVILIRYRQQLWALVKKKA